MARTKTENAWVKTDTGHLRFDNSLGIAVHISPRDEPYEEWRYRVADTHYTAAASYHVASVKALAIHRLTLEMSRLIEALQP